MLNDLLNLILNDRSRTAGSHVWQQVPAFLGSVKRYKMSVCFLEAEAIFTVYLLETSSAFCLQQVFMQLNP